MRIILTLFLLIALLAPHLLRAQYSREAFDIRQAQDLYDERGYMNGASISVDGKLAVSNQNGTPSYSYPISSFTSGGHQVTTTLNYCGSVQFTTFKDYDLADRELGNEYSGWARFHQNRPAWIMGVNGWAINVIGVASHFHAQPGSDLFNPLHKEFDDNDLLWMCDGYDFSGRMRDFKAMPQSEAYRDMIRILRADGSVMELLNIHTRTETNNTDPDILPELYTGYYFVNEANSRGYGIVSYDSTQFLGPAFDFMSSRVAGGKRYPLYPRVLRYFPGDGTEVIFREKTDPYGTLALADEEERGGGLWGHPTIFYLDEIRSNTGTVVEFKRARHNSAAEGVTPQTTRGRAPIVSYNGHEISLGDKSMTIEALGRTTKIKFGVVSRSGNTVANEIMPYARLGGATDYALDIAAYPESDPRLYKAFTGYVTEIIDPMNRSTKFGYETYSKIYENPGFPRNSTNGTIKLSLKNYRLKTITEPTSRFTLGYYGNRDETIPSDRAPYLPLRVLNNVVDSVRKYDAGGSLLTTDVYTFNEDLDNLDDVTISGQRTIDNITGHVKQTRFVYENYRLSNYEPILTPSRHTVLTQTTEFAGDITTGLTTTVSTTNYGLARYIPSWGGSGNYTVLPTSQLTTVNGITRNYQEFSYELDTLRDFWRTPELAAKYGMELTKKITRTVKPDEPSKVLLVDTTLYLHLPMPDTLLAWSPVRWNKFKTIKNFFRLRDTLQHPDVVGKKWEEVMYRYPVAVFEEDSSAEDHYIPPIFGLQERSWTTDPAGAVTGGRNVYLTDVMQNGEPAPRGSLVADSILGSDGRSILKGSYTYRREWSGHLLASTRNALGVETSYRYGQDRCLDIPFWEECTVSPPVLGTIIANDGTSRDHELAWSPFSYWFSKPSAEQSVVRRYDAQGNLHRDTLTSYSERTHYGQATGVVDLNGYFSRYDYDYNGRLNTAWTAFDFPGTNIETLPPFQGDEQIDLFGTTHHHRRGDILHCRKDGSSQIVEGLVQETINHDTLYAFLPFTRTPLCIACDPNHETEKKGDDRDLQSVPCRDQDFPYNEYGGFKGFFGQIGHQLDANSPIKSATRIDSLTFETMITSVDGSCAHLEVAIDSIFSKTFVLGCSSGEIPDEDDTPQSKAMGGKPGPMERSVQGLTAIAGGYKLVVDLSKIIPQLRSRSNGSQMNIELRVKTPGARVAFINGTNAEDLRPRLHVYGEHPKVWDRADYSLAYEYDDKNLSTTVRSKVDDVHHTANDLASQGIGVRRRTTKNFFGADYRVLRSEREVVEPGTTRTDRQRYTYTGLGAKTKSLDANGDSVLTRYDALNRPIAIVNPDGSTSTITYLHVRPDSIGITDQDFFGYCDVKILTNEKGEQTAQFSDALGRLRREVGDYGKSPHSNTTTRYEYDLLGRLVQVINPKGQVTTYTHDEFGRVKTKSHPDLGTISYAYDDLGNVRFTQDAEQARKSLLMFNQYDDLNRLVVVGEAFIDEGAKCGTYDEDNLNNGDCGDGSRLTDRLDGNRLHIYDKPEFATANPTLFRSPFWESPRFPDVATFKLRNCPLDPEPRLDETEAPTAPFIMHETKMYRPRNGGVSGVWLNEFEDLENYGEFSRIGINYDRMPFSTGALWSGFPLINRWDALTPTGKVRNLKGREAAVAYRDKASEPFHYSAMSYDERGRVEALLHYNENLGFDAVYYQYNSSNQIIGVMVADPLRRFTTWYGYDRQGRVDSVWTKLEGPGSGLLAGGNFNNLRFPGFPSHQGIEPELVYSYTKTDRIASLKYPAINTLVEYAYNPRTFLDSLIATRNGSVLFSQRLRYEVDGQILVQEYQHGTDRKKQIYRYDELNRLAGWTLDGKSTGYNYDPIGNRESVHRSNLPIETYSYYPGTNRLWTTSQPDYSAGDTVHSYGYNANGSQTSHLIQYRNFNGTSTLREEYLGYSFRGLNNRAFVHTGNSLWQDWRYRFGPSGEREQKRLYEVQDGVVPAPDSTIYPWMYYLLGGDQKQLAVYHGQQIDSTQTDCGDGGKNRVYLYPWEYITYGIGQAGVLITRPTGQKEYKLVDHLGSTRAILDQNGNVIGSYDSEPFGTPIAVAGVETRKGFIDKETDEETSTANHGVRQYCSRTGRFTSIDPMWEKFPSQSPYHYSFNNPLLLADADGKFPVPLLAPVALEVMASLGVGIAGAIGVYITVQVLEEGINFSEWMRTPAVSTDVDQPLQFFDVSLDNGNVITVPRSYVETAEGQWAMLFAIVAAEGGGDNDAPATEPPPAPVNGETSHTVRGKQIHKDWDYGEGWDTKVRLPSGKKPDAVNWDEREVIELKPNNPAKLKQYQKQLEGYLDELNKIHPDPEGRTWKGKIETYD